MNGLRGNGTDTWARLLQPEALARVGRLELLARGVVEGIVSGRHRSPYHGFSVEFAEHRQYVPGDNVRDLDWRVYGKSDRYTIKQYIDETNLRALILLDASGSMAFAGERAMELDGARLSKFEYGRLLAATLAYLLVAQQDAVGLVTFDSSPRRYIPPRSRTSHLRVMLEELTRTEPGAETELAPVLHHVADRANRRGLVIIISDLLDDPEHLLTALHHFRHRRHEVIVFHVLADEELTFPFDKWTLFRDLENPGQEIQLDPHAVKADYLDALRQYMERIRSGCGQMRVDHVPVNTSRPFDLVLAEYLARRRSLVK